MIDKDISKNLNAYQKIAARAERFFRKSANAILDFEIKLGTKVPFEIRGILSSFVEAGGEIPRLRKHLDILQRSIAKLSAKYRELLLEYFNVKAALERAHIDVLIGLLDKNGFQIAIANFFAHPERRHNDDGPVALWVMDLHDFKELNDTYGHMAADRVLRTMGELIATHFRSSLQQDICGRMGGDEFAVLIPHIPTAEHAELITERFRSAVKEQKWEDGILEVRIDIGVRVFRPSESWEGEVEKTDQLMYEAKRDSDPGKSVRYDIDFSATTFHLAKCS